MRSRTVAFIINSLEGGGAERVFAAILDALSERLSEHQVHVLLLDDREEKYALPSYVKAGRLRAQGSLAASVWRVRRTLRRIAPDVALSFLTRANCANIIAALSLKHRCLISERVNTSSHFGDGLSGKANKIAVRALYPMADGVLAVSQGVGEDLVRNFGVPRERIAVAYNPIDVERLHRLAAARGGLDRPPPYLVSAGRLTPNKNFEVLLQAYALAAPNEALVILGEGPDRARLETRARELGVGDRVSFPGYLDNPYPVIAAASLYICSSNAEGFPNALAEAMALGVPVVSTDCPSGPAEILAGGLVERPTAVYPARYGVLVEMNDADALAQGIELALAEPARSDYAARAAARAADFTVEAASETFWRALAA
ncbi:MAG: glycosyltransferase [Pseudomonadota bacterium]